MSRSSPTRSNAPSRLRLRSTSRRLRGPLARNARRCVARRARRRRVWSHHAAPHMQATHHQYSQVLRPPFLSGRGPKSSHHHFPTAPPSRDPLGSSPPESSASHHDLSQLNFI
ncbi:MAG: hypothetical protein WCQ91_08530 [Planctomycetota bacterium]